ncbi:MAG: hypothetical protein K2P67_08080 [Gallionellaceae bacterium]|nr:hypothetical protein [Gallionellaceae bacterium]
MTNIAFVILVEKYFELYPPLHEITRKPKQHPLEDIECDIVMAGPKNFLPYTRATRPTH